MGYHMEQVDGKFAIPADKKWAALSAMKALAGQETIRDASGPHFAWVSMAQVWACFTLEAGLDIWRWHPEGDGEGNIVDIQFEGEKAGDDLVMFTAIAPFVEPGSFIEMLGEDGDHWRWIFDGSTCREQHALIFWD